MATTMSSDWQKSSFSGGGQDNSCVELRDEGGAIAVRESDDPTTVITTRPAALRALTRRIQGEVFIRAAKG
ncbi:hypothetical protein GCM10010218_42550 [Streptomyces mashuensis]|uniref:DUF397 domain-containing protein n=1 Tax=Streptomyces mashuensis TaxID=33904 RepID=A0A919B4R8_9ACTN|nr:DUF397 domain-containing protein [Streptomyces mashuensis]GHF56693.1 hypothetical protein GCM10010218_42550 [Streptomyces mashuensis]